jgi:hypothetical protein
MDDKYTAPTEIEKLEQLHAEAAAEHDPIVREAMQNFWQGRIEKAKERVHAQGR